MPRILHIAASPRFTASYSYRAATALISEYQKVHPDFGCESLDLFSAGLPEFDAPAAAAKYAVLGGQEPRDAAAMVWQKVIEIVDHFKSAEIYVFSSPMWNFGIPYKLKQYIDIIVQPGLTFSYSPDTGYTGLVTGKRAVLVLARGGEYSSQAAYSPLDMQQPYLKTILGFMGVTDVRTLLVEPTLDQQAETVLSKAVQQAKELARSL